MTDCTYNDNLSADDQIDAEEAVATILFDAGMSEQEAQRLSRDVVMAVAIRLRPDCVDEAECE